MSILPEKMCVHNAFRHTVDEVTVPSFDGNTSNLVVDGQCGIAYSRELA